MTQAQVTRYNEVAADVQASNLSTAKKAALLQSVQYTAEGNASGGLAALSSAELSNEWLIYTFDAASFVGGRPNDRKPNVPA